jgi:hypothetical protein
LVNTAGGHLKKKAVGEREPHIKTATDVFWVADVYRRENIALRSILRKQSLSDPAIQSRVRRLLKKTEQDETAAEMLQQLYEETIRRLRDLDAQELLATIDPIGSVQ